MSLTQSHFRFGVAELAESTHKWLVGEDRAVMRIPGASGAFLLRACVQADATGLNNVDLEWQFRLTPKATATPGAWTNITTASAVVRTGANGVFANGANLTKRLSGTGTFVANNAGGTTDGTAGGTTNDIAANGCTETEIGLQIINADVAVGDLIEFRLTRDGGILLTDYPSVPSLRVGTEILTVAAQDTSVHFSQSAGVAKISGTVVQVECSGMSAADLADPTLSITTNVYGTTVVGSTDPADYTVPLQGPDVWHGGPPSPKTGVSLVPGFSFAEDIPEGVRRVLATFQPSRVCTFGANATVVEA